MRCCAKLSNYVEKLAGFSFPSKNYITKEKKKVIDQLVRLAKFNI